MFIIIIIKLHIFDSFGVEHIPKEMETFINRSLSIATNISRIQTYDSIICGYFCIGFIDFMLAVKTLAELSELPYMKLVVLCS